MNNLIILAASGRRIDKTDELTTFAKAEILKAATRIGQKKFSQEADENLAIFQLLINDFVKTLEGSRMTIEEVSIALEMGATDKLRTRDVFHLTIRTLNAWLNEYKEIYFDVRQPKKLELPPKKTTDADRMQIVRLSYANYARNPKSEIGEEVVYRVLHELGYKGLSSELLWDYTMKARDFLLAELRGKVLGGESKIAISVKNAIRATIQDLDNVVVGNKKSVPPELALATKRAILVDIYNGKLSQPKFDYKCLAI